MALTVVICDTANLSLEHIYNTNSVHGFLRFVTVHPPGTSNDKQLLTYWIVFGSLNFIESFLHNFLNRLVFYWLAKCILLIWLLQSEISFVKTSSDPQMTEMFKQERTVNHNAHSTD
jgi:type IV secretory pathway TrbD component